MNEAKRPCLPLFKSVAEAVALSKKEKDNFYIVALYIQRWLAQVNKDAVAEYAEKKNPRHRSLQTGSAWRTFRKVFGELSDHEFCYLFTCMARLTTCDDPVSRCLAQARFALKIEHDCSGDYLGPKSFPPPGSHPLPGSPRPSAFPRPSNGRGTEGEGHATGDARSSSVGSAKEDQEPISPPADMIRLLRRTAERWCDWLDAANHLHVHRSWHQAPLCFDPDVEKRDLAGIGLAQRHYSELNDWMKAAWQHLHAQFAQRFTHSPKWLTVGQAMASQNTREWTYHEVDTHIIYLWPLVKLHNWTYRDLLNVVRSLITQRQGLIAPKSIKAGLVAPKSSARGLAPPNSAAGRLAAPKSGEGGPTPQFRYPCEREQDFATYCTSVLGLRKTSRGRTTKSVHPAGYKVAHALFNI